MAYLPQKKKKAPELATGQPTTQTTTPSTSTKPATPTTTPNKSNTGWTNLNQYLDANKGAGTQMGKQVQAKVSTDVNQAKANLSDFTKAMNKQVNDQKLDTASLVQGLKNSPAKVDRNSYQKAQKHTYKGPKTFANGKGYAEITKASSGLSGLLRGDGHQQAKSLVEGTFKQPDYKAGSKNLDAFLFGQSTANQGIRDQIKLSHENYQNQLENNQNAVNKAIEDTLTANQIAKDNLSKAYTDTKANLQRDIEAARVAADNKNKAQGDWYSKALNALKTGKNVSQYIDFNQDGVKDEIDNSIYQTIRNAGANNWADYLDQNAQYGLGDTLDAAKKADWKAVLGLENTQDSYDYKAGGADARGKKAMLDNAGNYHSTLAAIQNRAKQALQNKQADPSYLWEAVRANNHEVLADQGISREDFDLMRAYQSEVGDIQGANIGVNPVASLGDVATNDEMKTLQALAKAMGFTAPEFNKTQGQIQYLDKVRGDLAGALNSVRQKRAKDAQNKQDKRLEKDVIEVAADPINKTAHEVVRRLPKIKTPW